MTAVDSSDSNDSSAPTEDTKQFTRRVADMIDGASAAMLISVGHQTGLFDTMAKLEPATSAEVAEAAGLQERYVREWLAGMVTARIVDYDPSASTYLLPEHRAVILTRAAGTRNLASLTLFVALLGAVEDKIIGCFRDGGGLPYSAYPRFHAVEAEQSAQLLDALLIDQILPLVDGLPERLAAGAEVADVGCGSGHAVNLMARAFPASRFTGIDFSDEALATGVAEADELGLTNATFRRGDLAELDLTEAYDVITAFSTIHDQAQPARVLSNVHAALRPGGVFLMVDAKASSRLEDNIGVPTSTYLYTVSMMHCMSVSLAYDGAGLGAAWGRQLATSMLGDAGFTDVTVSELKPDPAHYYYVAHKVVHKVAHKPAQP